MQIMELIISWILTRTIFIWRTNKNISTRRIVWGIFYIIYCQKIFLLHGYCFFVFQCFFGCSSVTTVTGPSLPSSSIRMSYGKTKDWVKKENNFPQTRKYWVDVQQGIVSSHGERDPLYPCLAILLEMVSQ